MITVTTPATLSGVFSVINLQISNLNLSAGFSKKKQEMDTTWYYLRSDLVYGICEKASCYHKTVLSNMVYKERDFHKTQLFLYGQCTCTSLDCSTANKHFW